MRESETISVLKRTQEREIVPGSSIFMLIFGIYSCVVTVLRGCVPINFFFSRHVRIKHASVLAWYLRSTWTHYPIWRVHVSQIIHDTHFFI